MPHCATDLTRCGDYLLGVHPQRDDLERHAPPHGLSDQEQSILAQNQRLDSHVSLNETTLVGQ